MEATKNRLRLTVQMAADLLSVSAGHIRNLAAKGVFTLLTPNGRGVGKRFYLDPQEVEIYGTKGEAALREFRIKKGRLPKPKK